MRKQPTHLHETLYFSNKIRENNKTIKTLEKNMCDLMPSKKDITFEEWIKLNKKNEPKEKELQKEIQKIKYETEILTLASNYKADDIRSNLYIKSYEALKELKLLEKNLTDLRKEKIKNALIKNGVIHENNFISIYRDSFGYINIRALAHTASYSEGIELYYNDKNAGFIDKMELKEIKADSYYLSVAETYLNNIHDLQKEIHDFNKKMNDKIKILEDLNKNYYDTRYIYNGAEINLYK